MGSLETENQLPEIVQQLMVLRTLKRLLGLIIYLLSVIKDFDKSAKFTRFLGTPLRHHLFKIWYSEKGDAVRGRCGLGLGPVIFT